MNVLWPIMTLACLVFAGCGPIAEQLSTKIRSDAIAAVSGQIDGAVPTAVALRVEGNPWGSGLLVYDANAADVNDVRLWVYYPNLVWTIPPSPSRSELFAFDGQTSKLTPGVRQLAEAHDNVRRESGLTAIPADVVRKTILRAIAEGVSIFEVRTRGPEFAMLRSR